MITSRKIVSNSSLRETPLRRCENERTRCGGYEARALTFTEESDEAIDM